MGKVHGELYGTDGTGWWGTADTSGIVDLGN